MRLPVALVMLALAATPAQAALLVTGFATNLQGSSDDDAVEITNTGTFPLSLDNVTVSDGEGTIAFPAGASIAAGGRLIVASDAAMYRDAARKLPDHSIMGPGADMRALDAGFALAQDGDELRVEMDGQLVDLVVWGDAAVSGPGWAGPPLNVTSTLLRWYPRVPGHDSDTKADWEQPQRPRLGWREPSVPTVAVDAGVAYTAPDQSRSVVSSFFRSAQSSLRLNVYEFRDVGLVEDLIGRMAERPDLNVSVLVDETPVGMSDEERLVRDGVLRELSQAGATVRLMRHDRYAYDHAKYAIGDDRWVLIQSENLVPSAMPPEARDGNRGWGVLLDSPALAAALSQAFDYDFELDLFGAREPGEGERNTVPLPAFATASPDPRLDRVEASRFNATLAVGPEAMLGPDDPLIAAIAAARQEILVEQLRISPTWRDASGRDWPNEYFNALLEAARRGVRVRVLLDGHFLDDPADDNSAAVLRMEEAGELLPIEARIMQDPESGVLHVKGLVVDRRLSWVGSMNWNLNSVAQNREVSVLVDAPEFAELFREAFESDWDRADRPPSTETPIPSPAFLLVAIVICVAAVAARAGARR